LFLHTHRCRELKEMSLILVSRRFSDSDESSSVVDKSLYGGDDRLVRPVLSSCIGCISVSHIQYHVDVIQDRRILPDVVKTDKHHLKRSPAQSFDHTCIGVVLLVIDRMMHHMVPPGTHP